MHIFNVTAPTKHRYWRDVSRAAKGGPDTTFPRDHGGKDVIVDMAFAFQHAHLRR